jgi:catechol 2,3-dioxygenase-like lactoylglutathione lyase family enzyme
MSISFSMQEHVSAGFEHVFAIATDFDRAKDWMNGLVGIEVVGSGPFGLRTRWAETRRMFGKNATEHFEVMEFEPPSKISLYVDGSKGSSKKGEYFFTYVIEEDTAVFAKLFGGFFKQAMKAYAEQTAA